MITKFAELVLISSATTKTKKRKIFFLYNICKKAQEKHFILPNKKDNRKRTERTRKRTTEIEHFVHRTCIRNYGKKNSVLFVVLSILFLWLFSFR